MAPSRHPEPDLLIDHAAGRLAAGQALVISAHLGVCAACRSDVRMAEAVGGVLLDDLAPVAMAADAMALALGRIERPVAAALATPARADWIAAPQAALYAARHRRRWAAPGVWVAPISKGPARLRTYLLGIGAGISVPRHTHRGAEMICVLKGAFHDGADVYGPGDFAFSDTDVEHKPMIPPSGDCVCLVAVEGALIPRDWVGRLFQPLVGI